MDNHASRFGQAAGDYPWRDIVEHELRAHQPGLYASTAWRAPDRFRPGTGPGLGPALAARRQDTTTSIDLAGRLNFYGLQALAAREIFASGEVLVRRYLRPPSWRMKVPLQLQLLQAEQMPIWLNTVAGV